MEEINRVIGMLERGMQSVMELWPVKLVASVVATIWTWLFGGTETIFAAVMGFVLLDTLTKWAAITRRWLIDHKAEPARITIIAIICAFPCAWEKNYLESAELRRRWGDKLFTYLILITVALLIRKLPEITLFGLAVNKSLTGGIYTCIALTELLSIVENFEEAGNKSLSSFKAFLINIAARITQSNSFSVSVGNYNQGSLHAPINAAQNKPITNSDIKKPPPAIINSTDQEGGINNDR